MVSKFYFKITFLASVIQLVIGAFFKPTRTHSCNECTEHRIQDVIDFGSIAAITDSTSLFVFSVIRKYFT